MESVMKENAKNVKKSAASNPVHPSSTESAPAPIAVAPATAIVMSMADPAVQECSALLDQVLGKLGAQDPMNADQIRRSTKMKKGGAEVIPRILALCQQHGVTKIGSLTVQEMSDQLKRGDALVQVGLRSALVQKKVKESAMAAHGRSWQIGTTMYTTLQRMAVDDPELAVGLADVQSFFQTKKTKGKVRENKKASVAKKLAKGAKGAGATPAAVGEPAAGGAVAAVPAATASGGGGAVASAGGGGAAAAPAQAPTPANGGSGTH
jgi:hypothetical protein